MTVDELDLIEPALSGARILQGKHPEAVFTSGRRTRFTQAHAMAVNVVTDRQWIAKTYRDSVITRECQRWVDEHPEADSVALLLGGFKLILDSFSDVELADWNHHLAGLAFDVQPQVENADAIKADIRALPHLNLFLEQEGNLIRWHAQFDPLPSSSGVAV